MPPFPKPRFDFEYDPAEEIRALRRYFAADPERTLPKKQKSRVLIATWNIANLRAAPTGPGLPGPRRDHQLVRRCRRPRGARQP